jgi:hypothetical protein
MDGYRSSLHTYLEMVDDDDSTKFLIVAREAQFATYSHLVEAETSQGRRRRCDAPPKRIRPRDHAAGHKKIKDDYFGPKPTYSDKQFRRR